MKSVHPLVKLARKTIQSFITNKVTPPLPKNLPDEFTSKRGVFVSIKKKGRLRGCIGTIEPVKKNVAGEVIHNAISASTQDPRFPSVTTEELDDITISVDILSPLEKITDLSELDPKKYGILLSCNFKKGVLLPDIEGINSVEEQIRIAKSKGDIKTYEKFQIQRFEVQRFSE